jgi:hypothetical protein
MTTTLNCPACGHPNAVPTERHWVRGARHDCAACGANMIDNDAAEATAAERMSLAEAEAIVARHGWDQVMEWARIGSEDPSALTPAQVDAISAFVLMRSAQQARH